MRDRAKKLGAEIVAAFTRRVDAWAAATLFHELSKLSNGELERRGIPRGDLHRHVFETLSKQ
jgi:hypothetical protein